MEQDEQDEQLYVSTVCLSWETFIFIEGGGARGSGIVGVNRGE